MEISSQCQCRIQTDVAGFIIDAAEMRRVLQSRTEERGLSVSSNREDGVSIDQIILSAKKYLTKRPGTAKNDTTILPATRRR